MSLFTFATDAAAQTYTLTVQSTPATGIVIGSTTGDGGATNYTVAGIASFATVQLSAPATDPTGYTFSRWTVNDTEQPAGLKPLTVTINVDLTAVAQYTLNSGTLVVQSTPPTGLSIGSSTVDAGMTNYTVANVAAGTSVNLVAPTTDPAGYTFGQWAVNGVAQAAGVKSVTFPAPAGFLQWGGYGTGDGQLIVPSAIALDNMGNVYVADQYNYRVQKFTSAGVYVTKWGTFGTGNGQFRGPFGIAVDADDNVYVADAFNNNIQKFTSNGVYLTQWGSYGSGNGQFNVPDGIAVDSLGYVYVADSNNFRVQKFTSDGGYLTQWGSQGSGNGQFEYSYGIAIDNLDNVYVADESNFRIQKFTTAGAYVAQWGSEGSGNGQLEFPAGIAVDDFGNVYVADMGNDRIEEFTSTGAYVTQWGSLGAGPGQFDDPYAVAVDGPGNVLYVADAANNRVEVLGQNILAVAQYATGTSTYPLTVQSTPPTGLSIASSNPGQGGMTNYTVPDVAYGTMVNLQAPQTDPAGYTFSQWTLNGASLGVGVKSVTFAAPAGFLSWGSEGSGNGQFNDPTGVAVATNGNVYVVDSENDRIQEFTSSGAYVTQWGGYGSGNGLFSSPTGIALDSAGDVYVVDTGNQLIQEFTAAGVFVTQWGGAGSGNGQFEYPTGIAIDTAVTGNVYVVDTYNERIQEFTSAGVYVTQWGSLGSGNGQFEFPTGIAVGSGSNVYVVDTYNERVQEFTSAGFYVTQWGSAGSGNGQFELPGGIATDSAGNVYVADTFNGRIQEFTSAGVYVTQWGSEGSGAGQFEYPEGVALNSAGNIYVADTDNQRIQEIFSQNILAVAQYTTGTDAYTLAVQSTPPLGLSIGSSSGDAGTTNYMVSGIADGTSVNLQAPATDPSGLYGFSQWTLNGVAQPVPPVGTPTSITFTMTADTTAVAQYGYTLSVQSTPPTGLSIGSSNMGQGGTTNYTVPGITNGTSVNLQAPATDPTGYTFEEWMVNGAALTAGQKEVTFTAPASFATWGSPGSGNGLFSYPEGIALDNANNVYVADTFNNRIQKFDSNGNFLTQWGGLGDGNGQFDFPIGIATDAANVYVADWDNNRIQKFTTAGAYVTQWGSLGSGNGQFHQPGAVAVDNLDNVYVADSGNSRIQKFTSAGVYVTQWGSLGSGNGQFDTPYGIVADALGNVYVADTQNFRIQKFTSAGAYLTQWGSQGSGNGQFASPYGVAADALGNVYVADTDNDRIQKFTSAGAYLTQWGSYGSANGQFSGPWSIAADVAGNVYVADTDNDRVQVFRQNLLAVAQYTTGTSTYTLTVQSTPPTGLSIGSSNTGQAGTTNYTVPGIAAETRVNLQAPAPDPVGYSFEHWTVNGTPQTTGKTITFRMPEKAVTAEAVYTANIY
ncbi:MAG: SMP-30/gluconolactonase/LRE family protein, partial [Candidatus Brocadiia bacterium]